jgi:hypothetical protein
MSTTFRRIAVSGAAIALEAPEMPPQVDRGSESPLEALEGHRDKAARVTIKLLVQGNPARLARVLTEMASELETGARSLVSRTPQPVPIDDTDRRLHKAAMTVALDWLSLTGQVWCHPSPNSFRALAYLLTVPKNTPESAPESVASAANP